MDDWDRQHRIPSGRTFESRRHESTRVRRETEGVWWCGRVALFWVELCGMLEKLRVLRCLESQDRSGRRPKHVGTWPRSSTRRYKLLVNVTAVTVM